MANSPPLPKPEYVRQEHFDSSFDFAPGDFQLHTCHLSGYAIFSSPALEPLSSSTSPQFGQGGLRPTTALIVQQLFAQVPCLFHQHDGVCPALQILYYVYKVLEQRRAQASNFGAVLSGAAAAVRSTRAHTARNKTRLRGCVFAHRAALQVSQISMFLAFCVE